MAFSVWESHHGLLTCVLGPLSQAEIEFVLDFCLAPPWWGQTTSCSGWGLAGG